MKIDYLFLTAAGKGTRMMDVGKIIPKPVFPFFESTIIDAHYKFMINKISTLQTVPAYFNSHHQRENLKKLILTKELTEIFEEDLLSVGGAIFNFKRQVSEKGLLLLSNADQFIQSNYWNDITKSEIDFDILLVAIKVKQGSGYNEILVDGNKFKGVNKEPKSDTYLTYCGTSIINLEKIGDLSGPQDFFYKVADFKNLKVRIIELKDYEYYDFGKLDIYIQNSFKVLNEVQLQDSFGKEMLDLGLIDIKKVNKQTKSYNSHSEKIINYGSRYKSVGINNLRIEKDDILFN